MPTEGQSQLPYRWTQTLATVDVNVPLEQGVRAREVQVDIRRTHLRIAIRGNVIAEVRAP